MLQYIQRNWLIFFITFWLTCFSSIKLKASASVYDIAHIRIPNQDGVAALRSKPETESPIVITVPHGEQVEICTQCLDPQIAKDRFENTWYYVYWEAANKGGWLHEDYLLYNSFDVRNISANVSYQDTLSIPNETCQRLYPFTVEGLTDIILVSNKEQVESCISSYNPYLVIGERKEIALIRELTNPADAVIREISVITGLPSHELYFVKIDPYRIDRIDNLPDGNYRICDFPPPKPVINDEEFWVSGDKVCYIFRKQENQVVGNLVFVESRGEDSICVSGIVNHNTVSGEAAEASWGLTEPPIEFSGSTLTRWNNYLQVASAFYSLNGKYGLYYRQALLNLNGFYLYNAGKYLPSYQDNCFDSLTN